MTDIEFSLSSAQRPQETAADNAALIAAIPEMVAALEAALCELSHCATQLAARGLTGHKDDSVSRAQAAARAVLKKVKP